MYGLALCLPSVGQPQGLPVPHKIPKTRKNLCKSVKSVVKIFIPFGERPAHGELRQKQVPSFRLKV
jgi:hypothetical protein